VTTISPEADGRKKKKGTTMFILPFSTSRGKEGGKKKGKGQEDRRPYVLRPGEKKDKRKAKSASADIAPFPAEKRRGKKGRKQ